MKKIFLLFPILLLCSCGQSGTTTEQINKTNYQKYLRTEVVDLGNTFQHNEKIIFSGALSFATYDVTVKYSGVNWETSEEGVWTLKLDIGGGGETLKIYGSIKIKDVSGTCTYKL